MTDRIRLVVTVKSYPSASVKYGEAVCVAGVRTDTPTPEWVRLYPVDFRDLPVDKQFNKWEEIEVNVSASADDRPESLKPDTTSIQVVGKRSPGKGWAERRPLIEPLIVGSMCEIRERQRQDRTSLGAFRPYEVTDVVKELEPEDWTDNQLANLSKLTLFAQDKSVLEKVPWRWKYVYRCGPGCRHEQTIIDWEIAQAWRGWRHAYGPEEAAERVRHKWLDELCAPTRDTVFFTGNQHLHRDSFLILGVYWPPNRRSEQVENLQLGLDL